MNKSAKITLAIVAILAVAIVIAVVVMNSKPKTNLDPITSAEDLSALVDKVYEGLQIEMPMLMTQAIDVTDSDAVKYITGLDNADDVEYVVASEPMMTSQAYSLVLVKVKDGANIEEMAKTMNENIDARKWICVTAEKIYTTTSGDVICLVMSREEVAKPVYEKFKTLAGTIGEEYERTEEDGQLPDDMLMPGGSELSPEDTLPAADPEDTLPAEDNTLPTVDTVE